MINPSEPKAAAAPFPLFARFPSLEQTLPRLALAAGFSPVQRLCALERRIGGEIWMKNDGVYGRLYGGNKPRKLEMILADAAAKGAQVILTGGALGTNHGLATAIYGAQMGFRVVVLLTYEHPGPSTAQNLCWMQAAGAVLHYVGSIPQAFLMAPYYMQRYRGGTPVRYPYPLWPGASTPLGAVGYVNAALELAEQVAEGQMPKPAAIFVPLGSAGTVAGLLLGLRLAGLHSRLIAVAVTRAPTAWASSVARLANSTARLLERRGAPSLPRVKASEVEVARRWLGKGFGRPSEEGARAQAMLAETEGLLLEPVYTAKTMAAVIDMVGSGGVAGPALYWHTYNAVAEPPRCTPEDYMKLPPSLRRFCVQ